MFVYFSKRNVVIHTIYECSLLGPHHLIHLKFTEASKQYYIQSFQGNNESTESDRQKSYTSQNCICQNSERS